MRAGPGPGWERRGWAGGTGLGVGGRGEKEPRAAGRAERLRVFVVFSGSGFNEGSGCSEPPDTALSLAAKFAGPALPAGISGA